MLQRAFQNLAALETNLDETNFVAVKLRIKKKKKKKAQSSDLGIFHEREFDLCTRSLDPHESGAFNHEPSFNRPEMKSFARPSFVACDEARKRVHADRTCPTRWRKQNSVRRITEAYFS